MKRLVKWFNTFSDEFGGTYVPVMKRVPKSKCNVVDVSDFWEDEDTHFRFYQCPACSDGYGVMPIENMDNYCRHCGVKLDWGE